jgi:hypothetical protein
LRIGCHPTRRNLIEQPLFFSALSSLDAVASVGSSTGSLVAFKYPRSSHAVTGCRKLKTGGWARTADRADKSGKIGVENIFDYNSSSTTNLILMRYINNGPVKPVSGSGQLFLQLNIAITTSWRLT